jgi:hypothetical protein
LLKEFTASVLGLLRWDFHWRSRDGAGEPLRHWRRPVSVLSDGRQAIPDLGKLQFTQVAFARSLGARRAAMDFQMPQGLGRGRLLLAYEPVR